MTISYTGTDSLENVLGLDFTCKLQCVPEKSSPLEMTPLLLNGRY